MHCDLSQNPHYRSAAPMCLYNLSCLDLFCFCNAASVCRDTRLAAADVLRKAASDPDLEKAVADPAGMQKAELVLRILWRI